MSTAFDPDARRLVVIGFVTGPTGTARVRVEGIDPHEWWAQQGRPVPLVLAQPQQVAQAPQPAVQAMAAPTEVYTPPAEQHAAAVLPTPVAVKKNASVPASGLYLQVGAFANPDAAELLKAKLSATVSAPVFISSVALNQQILHRVRLGPISTPGEVTQLQDSVRLANLEQERRTVEATLEALTSTADAR